MWTVVLVVGAMAVGLGSAAGAVVGTVLWHALTDPRGRAALVRLLQPRAPAPPAPRVVVLGAPPRARHAPPPRRRRALPDSARPTQPGTWGALGWDETPGPPPVDPMTQINEDAFVVAERRTAPPTLRAEDGHRRRVDVLPPPRPRKQTELTGPVGVMRRHRTTWSGDVVEIEETTARLWLRR